MKSELDDVIKRIRASAELIEKKDGQVIDLVKEKTFTRGPFLHQDTEEISEKESARFERDNPELFNFLRALDDQIRDQF